MKAIAAVVLGLAILVGFVAYSGLKPAPAPSAPIEAVALQEDTTDVAPSATARRFEIEPGQSQARFVIDEVLRGEPKTVVGATDQVAGELALDPTDPDAAQVGPILINARTFATDSTQRDRAIQNFILQTAEHEYIVFKPTQLLGVPDRAALGQPFNVKIAGELTIRGVARPVTFDATITPESPERLEGSASTTVRYADWGIGIPQVPAVTGVAEQVQLQLDFVARAA